VIDGTASRTYNEVAGLTVQHIKGDLMVRYLCLIAVLAGQTVAAQTLVTTGSPAADAVIAAALDEQRVIHTCSVLDDYSYGFITESWQQMAEESATIMLNGGVDPVQVAAFRLAALPASLLPSEDQSFAEVREFCAKHPGWMPDYARLKFVILNIELGRIFGQ
jgi:hypothetical protein